MPDMPPDLSVLALRYAAGDLPADQMTAFEERLAEDQPARDALAEAIRLSASAVGQPPPVPSAAVRAGARDRLFPTWLTWLFPRKSYRGHPATWAGLGGTVAATAAVLAYTLGGASTPTDPIIRSVTTPSRVLPRFVTLPAPVPAASVDAGNQAVAPADGEVPMPVPVPAVCGPRADGVFEPLEQMPVPKVAVECGRSNG